MRATLRSFLAKDVFGYVGPPVVGVEASCERRPAALAWAWRACAVIGSAEASEPSVPKVSSIGVLMRESHTPGLSNVYCVGEDTAATATELVASAGESVPSRLSPWIGLLRTPLRSR